MARSEVINSYSTYYDTAPSIFSHDEILYLLLRMPATIYHLVILRCKSLAALLPSLGIECTLLSCKGLGISYMSSTRGVPLRR